MQMRPSRTLLKLRAGEVVSCFKTNLTCARAAEIAAQAGFDCFWTDREHVANDWAVVERQIWATKIHNVDTMVRVSRGGYSDYIRPLELDAAGIMVPHIMSLADAQNVVRLTRFHPLGRRGIDGGNADSRYGNLELLDYMQQANTQRFLAVQIEDPEAMADLEAIAALEGIDIIYFGPADFSQGLGVPGQWNHPEVQAACRAVAQACVAHGKFAGTMGQPGTLGELIRMGYRFIHVGSDILGLNEYCHKVVGTFNQCIHELGFDAPPK